MDGQANTDLGGDPGAMLAQVANGTIAAWSEDKKKDFVKTFKDRARVAKYILHATANEIQDAALKRHFISPKHTRGRAVTSGETDYEEQRVHAAWNKVGGRDAKELHAIAQERAKAILAELPQVRSAVQIIKPDVAKMMDRCDSLRKKGQALCDELGELGRDVSLADVDQKMTIADFRAMVKGRARRKREILETLKEVGTEGTELESRVAKELYAGLPGLSDAVVRVIDQHRERAVAMDQVQRRVEEKVMFGDSKEAMSILESFERDEVEVSAQVRAEFGAALQTLRLAGKKARGK